jgi:N-methylhydantoinase B/oxoprolinase/acetone carboxylase alpha subunit
MTKKIDKIFASVLQKRFKSITEEMGLTLLRTTRSPILNEARDFVTGLYDARGRMLEQTEYIPVLAFAIQPACEYIVKYFGSDPTTMCSREGIRTLTWQLLSPYSMKEALWPGPHARVIRRT